MSGRVYEHEREYGYVMWAERRCKPVSTTEGPGWVMDLWQDLNDDATGPPWDRAGYVVTVEPGATPPTDRAALTTWAWHETSRPGADPFDRYEDAMVRGYDARTLREPPTFRQGWPPPP